MSETRNELPSDWGTTHRWMETARTWMYKAAKAFEAKGWSPMEHLAYFGEEPPVPQSYLLTDAEVAGFLYDVLSLVGRIAERLGRDDDFDHDYRAEVREYAQELVEKLQDLAASASLEERIRKLEQVHGRTPEETAAYLAKAAELRRANGPQEQP